MSMEKRRRRNSPEKDRSFAVARTAHLTSKAMEGRLSLTGSMDWDATMVRALDEHHQ